MVNVVFIRSNKARIRHGRLVVPWFELLTVPFPSPIEKGLTTRQLSIWKRGKFQKEKKLFQDKTSDLRGQALKVVTFEHVPSAVKMSKQLIEEQRGIADGMMRSNMDFDGLEIEVLETLAEAMNFEPKIYEPGQNERWGKKLVNGSFDGMIGEVRAHYK